MNEKQYAKIVRNKFKNGCNEMSKKNQENMKSNNSSTVPLSFFFFFFFFLGGGDPTILVQSPNLLFRDLYHAFLLNSGRNFTSEVCLPNKNLICN
jgi:hypothetical protein